MFLEYFFHQPVNLTNTYSGSLWIKPTDALDSNSIGITTLHASGSLSAHHQESLAVHRHGYILCSFDDRLLPEAGWTQFHPAPGSKRSCLCTAKDSWWWAERLPEACRVVIPIELESSASVGFIHKEFVTMHGHTILKYIFWVWILEWRLTVVTIWMQYFVIVTQQFRLLCHLQHRMWAWELFCRQHLLGDKPQCYLHTYKLLQTSVLRIISGCNENKWSIGGWEQKCFGW